MSSPLGLVLLVFPGHEVNLHINPSQYSKFLPACTLQERGNTSLVISLCCFAEPFRSYVEHEMLLFYLQSWVYLIGSLTGK